MKKLYLKSEFEDGTVYFKVSSIADPVDEYIYEALEIIYEDNDHWETDEYELTSQDLNEMYEDGFCEIEETEFDEAYTAAKKHIQQ